MTEMNSTVGDSLGQTALGRIDRVCVEGHLCWSRLYSVGAAYFAAAVLLPLAGLWAPVAYGLLYSATFVWLSLQKPKRPTGSSVTTVKYA
jgi:hypothetical protein